MAVAAPAQIGDPPAEARRRRIAGQGRAAVGGGSAACPGHPGRATATAASKPRSPPAGSAEGRGRLARARRRAQREARRAAGPLQPPAAHSGLGAREPAPRRAAALAAGERPAPGPRGPLPSAPAHAAALRPATESPPGESGSTSGYRRVQARAAPREGLRGAPQRQQGEKGLGESRDPGKGGRKRIPKRPLDAEGVRTRAVGPTEAESSASASVWSNERWVPGVTADGTVLPIGWEEEGLG